MLVTLRKPDRKISRRVVSKDASCVKEWLESGRPNPEQRRFILEGREEVQGIPRRMSSREDMSRE